MPESKGGLNLVLLPLPYWETTCGLRMMRHYVCLSKTKLMYQIPSSFLTHGLCSKQFSIFLIRLSPSTGPWSISCTAKIFALKMLAAKIYGKYKAIPVPRVSDLSSLIYFLYNIFNKLVNLLIYYLVL